MNNKLYWMICLLLAGFQLNAQMYNDGGLRLRVWAHKVWSAANCGDLGDQEYNIDNIQARVLNSTGSGYITQGKVNVAYFSGDENRFYSFNPNQMGYVSATFPVQANGYPLLDVIYGGSLAPKDFEVYIGSAFEDDCSGDILSCGQGNPIVYDQCCCVSIPFVGTVCALGDDYFATSNGWTAVNFRSGPEGQVNYTMPVFLSAGSENKYAVVFAYQWDWVTSKPLCSSPSYKDGNITVTCDLVGVFSDNDWDAGFCGLRLAGDADLRVKIQAKDNLTAGYPDFPTTTGSSLHISQDVPKWNNVGPINVFNKTYNTAATNFSSVDLAWDLWEEDGFYLSILGLGISCGTEDNYEGSDYSFPWFCINGDDAHLVTRVGAPGTTVTTGATINWRESPPNTDNYVEVPARIGSGTYNNWMLKFRYKWTISSPTVSIPTTDLQNCIGTAQTLTATTTNATYYQWQVASENGAGAGSCPGSGATWTNVAGQVCPTITFPQTAGTRTYRLVVYNRNGSGSTSSSGPKYDSAVSQCVRVTYFPYAPPISSVACGRTVPSGGSITFSVPSIPALNAIGDALAGWQYNWSISPTTNVAPTTGTGTTFSPTFSSAAAGTTYTVTLTVSDPCGAANATSTCTFNVTTPSCDQIYVAPAGAPGFGSDFNPGTASQPYATIATALANVSGSRTHIHVMGNTTYNETQWTIPANAIIDGGWEIVNLANSDWRKNSNLTTTVNMNPSQENDGTQGFYRGIISGGNSWLLQDLTINVKTGANQPSGTYNNRGLTVYGLYANGTTGWIVQRSTITVGNGTNGNSSSQPGGNGGAGGGGGGGAGGSGSNEGCYGSGQSNGSNGGNGSSNGGGGSAGSLGGGGSWTTGSGCNAVGCDANGSNGNSGGSGTNGGAGAGYSPGSRPGTPGATSPFYSPGAQASSGSPGAGGGGGGGGGGGDIGTCCTCSCGSGTPNGGNGGAGGGGGLGGPGGYGGGGSFGIYIVGSANGTLNQSSVTAGAGGTGGNGGAGQLGAGGGAGAGGTCHGGCDGGCGGSGGSGGNGGQGGRGQDGANGLAQALVTVSSTLNQNGCGSYACVGTAAPNTAPSAAGDLLKARYLKGCTNSFIEIQKANTSSTFDLSAMGASLINDESPNTTTFSNTNATTTTQVKFATTGWKLEDNTAALPWPNFIRITEDRAILPTISTSPKLICSGETVSFTITGNSPNQDYTTPAGSAVDYQWKYRIYKDGQVRRSPVPAWTTGTGIGPNTITLTNPTSDTLTYLIAAQVRDKCCGWSIWVFDSVLVAPSLNPPTAWTVCGGSPASGSNVCISSGSTLCVNAPTLPAGNPAYAQVQYRYSTDNGTTWSGWSTTNPSPISKVVGTTRVQTMVVIPSSYNKGSSCDTAVYGTDIYWNIDDTVSAVASVTDVTGCGAPNPSAQFTAVSPATGSGQWVLVSASPGVTTTPAVPTSSLTLDIDIPYGSSATYQWQVTNGACSSTQNLSITTATVDNANITQLSDACYTCYISDGSTYVFYDYIGKVVAKIKDLTSPSTELGNTEVCTHIHPYVQQVITSYADSMPYLQRYWTIHPDLSTDAEVTLYFYATEYNALKAKAAGGPYAFNFVSDLWVSKFPGGGGGAFTPPNTAGGEVMVPLTYANFAGNGTDYQVTFNCNSFSTFYIHPVRFPFEILPVELVSFTGTNVGDKNRLNWVTASEQNSDKFIVEKSLDGVNWFYLGEKPGAGNSHSVLNYELFDDLPVVGNNYYRLKMVDLDATFSYSNVINIPMASTVNTGIVTVYPNPTNGEITVLIASNSSYKTPVKVYDVLGKVVHSSVVQINAGLNTQQYNFKTLAAATYIISLVDDKGTEHKFKFVKQ